MFKERLDQRCGNRRQAVLCLGQCHRYDGFRHDLRCGGRRSTASDGDVALVLLGLIRCMQEALLRGEVVQLGALGNFRLSLGSSGVVNADDFHASLIRKPRIIYSPGVKLREMIAKVSIERIGQETDKSDAGGEDDRPGEL